METSVEHSVIITDPALTVAPAHSQEESNKKSEIYFTRTITKKDYNCFIRSSIIHNQWKCIKLFFLFLVREIILIRSFLCHIVWGRAQMQNDKRKKGNMFNL